MYIMLPENEKKKKSTACYHAAHKMAVEKQFLMAGQRCLGGAGSETTFSLSNSVYVSLSEEDKGDFGGREREGDNSICRTISL